MLRKVLHSKIHMIRVTAARPDYVGSITLPVDLLERVGMRVSDAVEIANCRNGERFETYILRGERGSGVCEVNGAAAHLVGPGDPLIVMHYALLTETEYDQHHPRVAVMAPDNTVAEMVAYSPGY